MASLKRRVFYGIVKGAQAGMVLSVIYILLFVLYVIVMMITAPAGGEGAGEMLVVIMAVLMVGFVTGSVPAFVMGAVSGVILSVVIETFYTHLTLTRATALGIVFTLAVASILNFYAFPDLPLALFYLFLPTPFYIGAGVWLSRRLYLMEQEVPFRELPVVPLADGETGLPEPTVER